jgi:hypothetical protein
MLLALTEDWDLMKDSHEYDVDSFEVCKRQDGVNVTNCTTYSTYVITSSLIIIASYFPNESGLVCLRRKSNSLQAWRFGVLNPVGGGGVRIFVTI